MAQPVSEWRVVESQSNAATLVWCGGTREYWIHSRFDPVAEGARFAETFADVSNPRKLAVVLGIGLGYHLVGLCKLPGELRFAHILAGEPGGAIGPASGVVEAMLAGQPRLTIVQSPEALQSHIITRLHHTAPQVEVIEHPVLRELRREAFWAWRRAINEALDLALGNMAAMLSWRETWTLNTLRNLRHVARSAPVRKLFGLWQGRPCVIASSGPSLTKQAGLLKSYRDRFLLVAAGSALKPLVRQGIQPDLIVSVDGGAANYQHFVGLTTCAPLVYEPMVYPAILDGHRGILFVGRTGNPVSLWLEKQGWVLGELSGGGSVAHVAMDLAVKMGARPIILIGQDLAFTGGYTHAEGAAHRRSVEPSNSPLLVQGYYGDLVPTSRPLNSYRLWFEYYLRVNPDVFVINATEGGARIEGARQMSFEEAIAEYCKDPQDPGQLSALATSSGYDWPDLVPGLDRARRELVFVKRTTAQATRLIAKFLRCTESDRWPTRAEQRILRQLADIDRSLLACDDAALLISDGIYRAWLTAAGRSVHQDLEQAREAAERSEVWRRALAVYMDMHRAADTVAKGVAAAARSLKRGPSQGRTRGITTAQSARG